MAQIQFLTGLVTWTIVGVFFISLVFVPVVSSFWSWWRTAFGQSLVLLEVLIALTLLPATVKRLFGLDAGTRFDLWFTVVALWLVGITIIGRAWVLYKIQRGGIDPEEERENHGQRRGNRRQRVPDGHDDS